MNDRVAILPANVIAGCEMVQVIDSAFVAFDLVHER